MSERFYHFGGTIIDADTRESMTPHEAFVFAVALIRDSHPGDPRRQHAIEIKHAIEEAARWPHPVG